MKLLLVAAVALIDPDGRVLISERPAGKTLAGLWEFPGGKVEPGERPEQALIRELREEIGLTVEEPCLAPLTFASHVYPDMHLLMPLYVCRRWSGFAQPLEGQRLKWVWPRDLRGYPMPPADEPLIPALIDLVGSAGLGQPASLRMPPQRGRRSLSIIDHLGFGVSDYGRAKIFYTAALAPLGIGVVMEVTPAMSEDKVWAVGFGRDGKPEFWIGSDGRTTPQLHVALLAESREQVRAFHEAAVAAGGRDNGGPGLRPHYHPHYYAAFVLDLDGHNVEAVCHGPE